MILYTTSIQHRVSLISVMQTVGQFATLNVRIPTWTSSSGAKATLNDKDLELTSPGMLISNQHRNKINEIFELPLSLMNCREVFLIQSRFVSGTFLTISKQWDSGDRLSLQLPIHLRTEAIKGEFQALFTIRFLKSYLQ